MEKIVKHCGKNTKEDLKTNKETYVHGSEDSVSYVHQFLPNNLEIQLNFQ